MLYEVTLDTGNPPELKNKKETPYITETGYAAVAPYAVQKCLNCGGSYHPSDPICAKCGLIFSSKEKTARLMIGTDERPTRTRRTGELTKNDQEPIMFLINNRLLIIPVATIVIIGRKNLDSADKLPDIDLSPFDALKCGISRQHLRLTRTRDMVLMADLGSLNGTYLNGSRLAPHQERVLRNGDEMLIGRLNEVVRFASIAKKTFRDDYLHQPSPLSLD
jgi:FHA domain